MTEDSALHAADFESLARLRFGKLSEAEKRLLYSAHKGETAVCGVSSDIRHPTNDPAKADSWGDERVIRAELIAWLCVDETAHKKVDRRGIWAVGAKIIGELDLSYATVPFPLNLAGCRLTHDTKLTYAKIPELCLNSSRTRCLLAEGVDVRGSLLLQQGFFAEGEVRLIAAQIGSTLNCEDSTFSNPVDSPKCSGPREEDKRGTAISADRIRVEGGLFLRAKLGRFKAEGEVRLNGARVGGDLSFRGSTLRNLPGIALSAQNAAVGGNVFLSDLVRPNDFEDFSAYGTVDLLGAKVGGNLYCTGGEFDELILNTVAVKGMFAWSQVKNPNVARLDLRNASVGSLVDDEESWPVRGNLHLDGFQYDRISGTPWVDSFGQELSKEEFEEIKRRLQQHPVKDSPTDAPTRLKWLDRDVEFKPQPYRQLAKVLRESGDEEGSKEVLFQLKRREHSGSRRNFLTRVGDWTLEGSVGYGVYPEWAAKELLGFMAVGAFFFWRARRAKLMVPTEKDACKEFQGPKGLPLHYPRFNSLIYALESCVPLLKLGMAERWQPDPSQPPTVTIYPASGWRARLLEGTNRARPPATLSRVIEWALTRLPSYLTSRAARLRCLRWFLVVVGWLLTLAFVAAITNMFKIGQ